MSRQVLLVARREVRSFFDQPTAYILAVAFLGLSLYISFRSLYAIGAASLRPLFDLLPWLFVVFIPAVAMKSLAEERRSGTLEWLLAQPLTEAELVLGKFLGNWLFVMIALVGTLPTALGVLVVSEADPGIMIAQYAGAALLAAQMVAVGLWASSLTSNQITAFILGAFVCFALVLIGTPVVQIGLPRLLGGWASQLSVMSHFENVARGVVDLRDLLYFASTCGLFLLLALAALGHQRLSREGDTFRRLRLGTGVITLGVLMLNLLGGHIRGRLDLTRGNLFTLSSGSRDMLAGLDDFVNLKLFVSDDLPQQTQLMLRDVRDLTADLANASDGRLVVEEINPDDSEEAGEEASSQGVLPIEFNVLGDDEFQVKRGYFGLAISYADERETIPIIDRVDDLEFRLVSAVASMTADRLPVLAFGSGFEAKESFHYRAFREGLADRYRITTIDLQNDSARALRPDSIDVLMVAAPTQPLTPEASGAIDDYLNAGGAALFLMERHALDPQSPMSMPVNTGLEGVLSARGVDAPDGMVFDLASAERISIGRQGIFNVVSTYPLWPVAFPGEDHPTNRGLSNVTFGWAAPFTWEEDDPSVTSLWATTDAGGTRPAGSIIAPRTQIEPNEDETSVQVLAVAVDASESDDESGEGDEENERPGGRIIAVGDSDFLEDRFVQANSQNLIFAANAVDWLAQDEALIGIRSKDRTPPALVFESDFDKSALKWGSMIGVPLLFVVVGFLRVTGRTGRAKRRWDDATGGDANHE